MLAIDSIKSIPVSRHYGLGQIDIGSILDSAGGDITSAAGSLLDNLNLQFGGGPHPWIPAQNSTENSIAAIVAAYVQLKNAGQLTSTYINNAIAQVQTAATGFAKFASQYSSIDAQHGINDIQNNANAVIANMRNDLATLPVGALSTLFSGSGSTLLLLGIGAYLFLKR